MSNCIFFCFLSLTRNRRQLFLEKDIKRPSILTVHSHTDLTEVPASLFSNITTTSISVLGLCQTRITKLQLEEFLSSIPSPLPPSGHITSTTSFPDSRTSTSPPSHLQHLRHLDLSGHDLSGLSTKSLTGLTSVSTVHLQSATLDPPTLASLFTSLASPDTKVVFSPSSLSLLQRLTRKVLSLCFNKTTDSKGYSQGRKPFSAHDRPLHFEC